MAGSHVKDGSLATSSFDASGALQVKQSGPAGYSRKAYLKSDISNISSISKAELRLLGRV